MSEQDPYTVLGVPPDATDKEIRNAYAARSKILHPDRFDRKKQPKEWAQAYEMHGELNRAYTTLRQAIQRSEHNTQNTDAGSAIRQIAPPPLTPKTPLARQRYKLDAFDVHVILGLLLVGFWGIYSGGMSLWRESGVEKVAHHLSLTELRDATLPSNRLLKVSDAECDLRRGGAHIKKHVPQAYYIPLVTSSGLPNPETPKAGRTIILRLTKKLYDAHSGALKNNGVPLTVEGIRMLNTDIESRVEKFLKNELGIANLNSVVVIDGGRRPVGTLLSIKILIISVAWVLMLLFSLARKPKFAWSAIAVLCGAFAIVPDRLWLEPGYESPLVSQATAATSPPLTSQRSAAGTSTSSGSSSTAPVTLPAKAQTENEPISSPLAKLRKAAEQGDASAQSRLGDMYKAGEGVSKDAAEAVRWYRKAAEQGNVSAQSSIVEMYIFVEGAAKDAAEAVKWCRQAADQGYASAQNNLGLAYAFGIGVPRNAAEAVKWYRKAAEQGDTSEQTNLGFIYHLGGGAVARDDFEAAKWFRKAAEQGMPESQHALGEMHRRGEGVTKNAAEAVTWYRKAAEQGDAFAQIRLGEMYRRGEGVARNAAEAVRWYREAAEHAEQGDENVQRIFHRDLADAQFALGDMYKAGEGVSKDAAEAVRWYRKAAEQGNASAQSSLALMYARGEGTAKDAAEAVKWLHEAAEQGNAAAQRNLGSMYKTNEGVPKDFVEAVKWYRKAAEQGDARAQSSLGVMYVTGEGVAKNNAEAVKWFHKAAEQGNAAAQRNLGIMYKANEGVPKDFVEAVKWYRKAAEQGDAWAQKSLGVMYARGEGIAANAVEAVKWYRKAAEQGDASAQFNLGAMYASGEGVAKNAVEAVKWYRKAAEQDHALAQAWMGEVNRKGSGVPKDEIEALAWYYIAAASGYERVNQARTFLENRLGPQVSLLAQRRSKEILNTIEAAKAKSARNTQSEQPGDADREETPKRGQSGTGVFVTTDGLILTAAHVVKGASSIEIQTSHGVKPGRLVKVDTKNDLALIRCEGKFQAAPVKAPRGVKLGQAVFTIGFPNVELQGVSPKMTRGEISSVAGLQDDPGQWQISVPVQPGNSGGPLFDEAGNVIGVIVAKLNAIKAAKFTGDLSQNVNYAVKSAPALQLLAPYNEKLARERQVNPSDKVENVVEQCRESVVLIFGYGP